jgi:Protein of unknown function (DUF3040)
LEDDMPLSPREQQILAGIARDLGEKDPVFARTFARTRRPSSAASRQVRRWFPLSLVDTGLLVLILIVLVAAHTVGLGLPWVSLLTAMLIVPWLLRAARTGTPTPIGGGTAPADDRAASDIPNDR